MASLSKAREERDFLRSLNEQLLSNQKALRTSAEEAKGKLDDRDATIKDLQEQVRQIVIVCFHLWLLSFLWQLCQL